MEKIKPIPLKHKVNIDLISAKKIVCECGKKLWEEVILCTKVPALMANTPTDQLVMVKILRCVECKRVMPDHLPFLNEKEIESEPTKLKIL